MSWRLKGEEGDASSSLGDMLQGVGFPLRRVENIAGSGLSPAGYLGLAQQALFPSAGQCWLSDDIFFDLTIPTVVPGNNEIAHPSVLFIPEGFQGKQWWMAATPIPVELGGDYEAWENPSIYVSDTGRDWAAPAGLTNPISPDPGPASDHNADTCLVLSPDRKTLYCLWTEVIYSTPQDTERVQMKSSTDGVNWSEIVTLLEVDPNVERVLCPQLNWDPLNSEWVLHTTDAVPANNVMNYCTRADLNGQFGARTQCTYTLPPGETDVWHMDIRRLPTGRWFGLIGTDSGGGPHPQFPMHSDDAGRTWIIGEKLSERLGYKCAFVPIDEYSGLMYWGLRGGPDWHFELVKLWFNGGAASVAQSVFEVGAPAGAANKVGRYFMEDSFQRADESPITNADSGEPWLAVAGQFNVVSNQMVANSATNNVATINTGFNNAEIIVRMSNIGATFAYVVVRLSSSSQFHRIGIATGTFKFQRVGGSGTADIRSVAMAAGSVRNIRVVCRGTIYSLYLDGTFMFQVDLPDHQGNTQFGVQCSETGTKIDQVIISRL